VKPFIHSTRVRLQHTDAAGIIFFGSLFSLFEEAFEERLESLGFPLSGLLADSEILFPIVHSEADYLKPLRAGDAIRIGVELEQAGPSSVRTRFTVWNRKKEIAAKGAIVSVVVDCRTWSKRPLPGRMKKALRV
jgi:YbgC/YbaW family acyl-CoA thioester hydrolase